MTNKVSVGGILTAIISTVILIFIFVIVFAVYNNSNQELPQPTPSIIKAVSTNTPEPTSTPIKAVELPEGDLSEHGLDTDKINELDSFIASEIADGFPGAVLMIARDGNIVFHKSYGYKVKYDGLKLLDNPEKMDEDTVFDLASLTKVYATTLCIMKLFDEGKISIDDKVVQYLPGYVGDNKEHVTISMLLSHLSGHTNTYALYSLEKDEYYAMDKTTAKQVIESIPLDDVPNTIYKYSDTNYMLLGSIVEAVTGMSIDSYAYENIYKPLGLARTTYKPLENGISISETAASERCGNTRDMTRFFDGIREYTIRGEVHDENAYYSFEGVSGHAGLFSDANGLTILNTMLLSGGEIDGVRILSESTVDKFMNIYNDEHYQLGFWNANAYRKLTDYVDGRVFYHNGWTGCASIVDYEKDLSIILLTNKRHCPIIDEAFAADKDFELGKYYRVIQMIYDAILE